MTKEEMNARFDRNLARVEKLISIYETHRAGAAGKSMDAAKKQPHAGITGGRGGGAAMCLGIALMISVAQAAVAAEAAPVAPADSRSRNLADIVGTSHVRPLYYLTDQDILNEGADQVLKLGMRVIKVWLSNGNETPATMYPYHSKWPEAGSLVEVAQLSYFKTLFSKPFRTYIFNVTSMGRDPYYWRTGISQEQIDDETKQFHALTQHLLTTYQGSGKTFVLQHHEGDWHTRGHTRRDEPAPPEIHRNMIKWLNARQAGVNKAREEVRQKGVFVYHAAEINLVVPSMEKGQPNMVNKVLPFTNLDLVSYSAYDSTVGNPDKPEVFLKALDYIAENMPDSPRFGNRNVYLGEYGLPENDSLAVNVQKVISHTTQTALDWGCPYVVYWQLYCNEPLRNPVQKDKLPYKNNRDCRGFWLIRADGTHSWAWNYFSELLKQKPSGALH